MPTATSTARKPASKTSAKIPKPKIDALKTKAPKVDAIVILKADHKTVDALFKAYEKAGNNGAKKSEIAGKICDELTVHAAIEEEIFYPEGYEASQGDKEDKAMLDEAEIEHEGVKRLVGEIGEALERGHPDDMTDARVQVLSEYIKHHVKEEEEDLFPALKKTDMDMAEVGARMLKLKEKLHAEIAGHSKPD